MIVASVELPLKRGVGGCVSTISVFKFRKKKNWGGEGNESFLGPQLLGERDVLL